MCSWWWAKEPPETYRASVKINKFKKRCILLAVICKCITMHGHMNISFVSLVSVCTMFRSWPKRAACIPSWSSRFFMRAVASKTRPNNCSFVSTLLFCKLRLSFNPTNKNLTSYICRFKQLYLGNWGIYHLRDLRFSERWCWRCSSFAMLRLIDEQIFTEISKETVDMS